MTAGTIEINPSWHKQFTTGHLVLIFGAALVLTAFLFIKDPQYFKFSFNNFVPANNNFVASRYQPYVLSAQPAVLGASTNDDLGPEVLNEDGTITNAADPGAVLGANTQQLATDVGSIKVKTSFSNRDSVDNYLQSITYWEITVIDQNAFESALTSKNQTQINSQIQAMQTMLYYLEDMTVPADAGQLHKLKIAQYRSAIILLQNFSQADNNPQLVTDQLGVFLQSQEQQDHEVTNLRQKYNLAG